MICLNKSKICLFLLRLDVTQSQLKSPPEAKSDPQVPTPAAPTPVTTSAAPTPVTTPAAPVIPVAAPELPPQEDVFKREVQVLNYIELFHFYLIVNAHTHTQI